MVAALRTQYGEAMRSIYRFFFITLAGWRIEDLRSGPLERFIVVVAPHTSNWDFFVGLCVRSLSHMDGTKYLAKRSLFTPPWAGSSGHWAAIRWTAANTTTWWTR